MDNIFLNWRAWLAVLALTTLTLISSVAKYRIGQAGLKALEEHFPQIGQERWDRAGNYFQRWGSPVVLLSILPVLGFIIPPAAGAFGIEFKPFLAWAFVAKMIRYWILLLILTGGLSLLT